MSNVCPKGHFSTDQDYCSECGVAMSSAGAGVPSTPASGSAGHPAADAAGAAKGLASIIAAARCPECMTERHADARYCEACRYDFVNRTSFSSLADSAPASAPAPVAVAPLPAPVPTAGHDQTHVLQAPRASGDSATRSTGPAGSQPRLLLRIVVDAALYTEPDPQSPCPVDRPAKVFHLDLDENTLGRQFEGKGVHPEIVVQDPSISRRHLKFVRIAEGGYAVLELGSANGSEFNGKYLDPGVMTPVNPGDQLTLGMWTRIHVEAR